MFFNPQGYVTTNILAINSKLELKGKKQKKRPSTIISISGVMAGDCTQNSSLDTTSSIHNWWPDLRACSLSSWSTTNNSGYAELDNNSESSGEESVPVSASFTNGSHHSGLSVESSSDLIGETAVPDNHIWNHVILSEGNNGGLPRSQQFREPLQEGLTPKNISSDIYDTASHYTRKRENSWILSNTGSFNNIEKQFNAVNHTLLESERESKLSNFDGSWVVPTQDGDVNHQTEPRNRIMNPNSVIMDPFSVFGLGRQSLDKFFYPVSCFGHDVHPLVLGHTNLGDKSRYSNGLPNIPGTNSESFPKVFSSVGNISRSIFDSKPILKTLDLSDFQKQAFQTSQFSSPKSTSSSALARQKRTGAYTSGGKKRKSEENLESILKKPKQDATPVSCTKIQFPKAKLAEKIAALQQIVSPFGKTDTASVLWEAIGHIRFLQEQIQLLSSPYMKGNVSKDLWGRFDRKDRGDGKLDLKSRGLCLVPVSCASQVNRNSTGSGHLSPLYRGCLYR